MGTDHLNIQVSVQFNVVLLLALSALTIFAGKTNR
jgi:hypothetical protein